MKLKRAFVLLALFALLTGIISAENGGYQMPAELPLCQNDAILEPTHNIPVLETRFFPIGWSQNNKFAYISYFEDHDASGLVSAQLKIFDIVTNTIELGKAPAKEYDIITTFSEIWNENQDFFFDLLEQHGIIQQTLVLNNFPLIFEGDTLDYTIDDEWIEVEESEMGWAYIDDLNVQIRSKKLGIKTIYEQSGQYSCIGAQVCGYIKNPCSDRVVIPMVLLHPGWEGPPCVTTIHIIGCHLTEGFTDPTK